MNAWSGRGGSRRGGLRHDDGPGTVDALPNFHYPQPAAEKASDYKVALLFVLLAFARDIGSPLLRLQVADPFGPRHELAVLLDSREVARGVLAPLRRIDGIEGFVSCTHSGLKVGRERVCAGHEGNVAPMIRWKKRTTCSECIVRHPAGLAERDRLISATQRDCNNIRPRRMVTPLK